MDKMSLLSILLVSVPEEFLIVLMLCLLVGRRDIINFRQKSNIYRVIIATVLTVAWADFIRAHIENVLFIFTSNMVVATIVYVLVLRIKWYKASLGVLVIFVIHLVIESIAAIGMLAISGVTLEQMYSNDIMRIIFTLPIRLMQVAIVVLLYNLKKTMISFNWFEKFPNKMAKKIALIHIYLFIAFIQISVTFKHYLFNFDTPNYVDKPFFWINMLLIITMSILVVLITANIFAKNMTIPLYVFLALSQILLTVNYFTIGFKTSINTKQSFFWLNTGITVILAVLMALITIKHNRGIRDEKQEQIIGLMWLKTLLDKHETDTEGMKMEVDEMIAELGRKK